MTVEAQVDAPPAVAPISLFHRAWPPALLILGLVFTMVWTALLGCGLVELFAVTLFRS